MIILKRITAKNFLSYGNTPVVFDLNTYKTTLIRGRNGHGKSVILDLVLYALYGKPYRSITKPQLINSINKNHMFVQIEFSVAGVDYQIHRGMKPNVFDIFCGDKLIEQDAAMRDYQEFLETQILKVSEKTFKQIAVLGSASYIPFMQLAAYQRRDLIESILDIEVFSKMNVVLKDRMSSTKEELKSIGHKVDVKKVEATSQQKLIKVMQENNASRIHEYEQERDVLRQKLVNVDRVVDELSEELAMLSGQEPEFDDAKMELINSNISAAYRAITVAENKIKGVHTIDECPVCMQSVSANHVHDIAKSLRDSIKSHNVDLELFLIEQANLKEQQSVLYEYQSAYSKLVTKLTNEQRESMAIQKAIADIDSKIIAITTNTGDIEAERIKLKKIGEEAMSIIERKNTLTEEKHLQDVAAQLLKDTGIKTAVVKEYLPVLNQLINKYLSDFEFFVEFNLDESFTEVIKSRGRDVFTYSSFSEGEKRRIDLSILLAFRTLAALKNSAKTNILIFDEILDSNLDLIAREQVQEIIANIKNSNTIVISHADSSDNGFDRTIIVEKVGDFSEYVEMN